MPAGLVTVTLFVMRVYLGSDHAGYELKRHLVSWLAEHGYEPVDCGPERYDPADDYPPYVLRAALATVGDEGSLGVVLGGSGNGEAIAANKVPGVRAVLAWNLEIARLGRKHNDANVISVGARMHDEETATAFVEAFVTTDYAGEQRHARRIEMLNRFEEDGKLPPA